MRALALLFLFAMVACQAPRTAVQHVKPDSSPVTRPVLQTRAAIAETKTAVREANATATAGANASVIASKRATDIAHAAAAAAERGLAAKSEEANALASQTAQLAGEVDSLKSNLFRVTMQLREAENAALEAEARNAEAEHKLVDFDALVAKQTAELNQREIALAGARAEKELAQAAMEEAEGKLRVIRLKVAAWVALAVLILAGGFYFKLLRFGA